MRFDIMTLFPEFVDGILNESIIGRARKSGSIEVYCHNIRDYSKDKHRKTDDTPFGGGVGMVMTCQPIYDCYTEIKSQIPAENKTRVIYMSPKGRMFSHDVAKELAEYDNLVFLCGHYEGVDQRIIDEIVDDEISIGDYVVTGGEIPACILVDCVARMVDGVLADEECYKKESIASGLLEYPQYTKPALWRGREVPSVLLSGDHAKVDAWRQEQAMLLTGKNRPELLERYLTENPPPVPKKKRQTKKALVDNVSERSEENV